ncbi:phosphonoacetaldehyde hydrolase [Erysipelotrichaceae bacterium HCN-30851]
MKIEAVIFDWAGTTVDYGCFAPVQAFIEVFKEFGMEVTMEETRKPMGMLKWDHIKTMLEMPRIHDLWLQAHGREVENKDIDEMHDAFTGKLMGILDQFSDPKPYVVETIETLRKMGLKIGSTTGYTDQMMEVVTKVAKEKGYEPDFWITPNSVENYGRPYPYMVFENLKHLHVTSVHAAVKVGDTISDIKEGIAAGVTTVGIIEGSSLMGLTQEEFENLTDKEKQLCYEKVEKQYKDAGADYVISTIKELPSLIESL